MKYFENKDNVKEYISMVEGYDGSELIDILKKHLAQNSSIFELGMGPGKDLDILNKTFIATGSDYSSVFLDLYFEKNKSADLIELDAVSIETERKFDCIYSNKVLHHLTREDLKKSFKRQSEVLKDRGILFHSFWYGDKEENHHGLRFVYYNEESVSDVVLNQYELIEINKYKEMSESDSFYLILRKK